MTKIILLISFYAFTLYLFLAKIIKLLQEIICLLKPKKAVRIDIYAQINGKLQKVNNMELKVTQQLPLVLVATDKFGNVVPTPSGLPVWTQSVDTFTVLEVAVDGLSAVLKPNGQLGAVDIGATLDLLVAVPVHVDLVAGPVAAIEIVPGTPVDM